MGELTLIRGAAHPSAFHGHGGKRVRLRADRGTLMKRRWRGVAEDGREFGFDLDHALAHETPFFAADGADYFIDQLPETVLEIAFSSAEEAARLAWNIGNLHFGLQVVAGAVRVVEDPAVLQFLAREGMAHRRVSCIFLPLSAGSSHHHHDHAHAHG